MPPAIIAAYSGGGGATSASKHLFSSVPPVPSFNDPLSSSHSSSLSLPKRAPNPQRTHKSSDFQSIPYHKTLKPVSPTEDKQLTRSSQSYRFQFPPSKPQFSNSSTHNPNPDFETPQRAAFKSAHLRTRYQKPVKVTSEPTVLSSEGDTGDDRSVVVGPSGISYRLPGAPFDFQYSYSETPRVAPIAIREPAFLPFAPPSMPRPWTGKAPLLSKKEKEIKKGKKIHLAEPLGSEAQSSENNELLQKGGLIRHVMGMKKGLSDQLRLGLCKVGDQRSREEVLGEPLSKFEIAKLVKPHLSHNRQVNLGRDGLTHNMLELVHCHWRRDEVCKIRCRGVPTIDMDNIIRCLEEKTMGKVIHRTGGKLYLFRGRNYNPRTRPRYPIMLWKPAAPVYPRLIQHVPEGLTREEATEMRLKGEKLLPICKLVKNGIYTHLVKDVRDAFEGSELVKIDCGGMEPTDYKKLSAKLKDLVPCVLLSFDNEQILIYRGKDWKSQYPVPWDKLPISNSKVEPSEKISAGESNNTIRNNEITIEKTVNPKMISLYNRAIESSKALLLNESELLELDPDSLLKRVEDFESVCQALIVENGEKDETHVNLVHDEEIEQDEVNENYFDDNLEDYIKESVPFGSLPIDIMIGKFSEK